MDPVIVLAKVLVRSFTHSWGNSDWSFGWGGLPIVTVPIPIIIRALFFLQVIEFYPETKDRWYCTSIAAFGLVSVLGSEIFLREGSSFHGRLRPLSTTLKAYIFRRGILWGQAHRARKSGERTQRNTVSCPMQRARTVPGCQTVCVHFAFLMTAITLQFSACGCLNGVYYGAGIKW